MENDLFEKGSYFLDFNNIINTGELLIHESCYHSLFLKNSIKSWKIRYFIKNNLHIQFIFCETNKTCAKFIYTQQYSC